MKNIEYKVAQILLVLIGLFFIISGLSIFITAAIAIAENARNDYTFISTSMILFGGIILLLMALLPLIAFKVLKPSHPRFIHWGMVIISIAMLLGVAGPFFF